MPRLSCIFCFYANRDALTLAGSHNINLLREYVRIEKEIGHTFKTKLSLASVLADVERGHIPKKALAWQG